MRNPTSAPRWPAIRMGSSLTSRCARNNCAINDRDSRSRRGVHGSRPRCAGHVFRLAPGGGRQGGGWSRRGAIVMLGLASAALWGAVFHAAFPAKTATAAGFVVWLLVAFSIAVVAGSLLDMALTIFFARLAPDVGPEVRRAFRWGYCLLFACILLFVGDSFSAVVRL